MLGKAVGLAAAAACFAATAGRAQERDASEDPTAEEMIAVEREAWRAPGIRRRCPAPKAGEIVVCAPNPDEFRVESPTDEAIRKGEAVRDSALRAPDVFGLPPCRSYTFCGKVGRTPEPPLLIDLEALPHPLTPEEAALVFRAEDLPTEPAATETAAPAESP
jgi:hypothetical protein